MTEPIHAVLSSLGLVAISEMGDKTQLLAFSLAARFKKPMPVMIGILVATLLNHGLASWVGATASAKLDPKTIAWVLAVLFFGFGVWTLKPDELNEGDHKSQYGAFAATAVLFFLAEMGDKTQFATVALAAQFESIGWVTLGTTLGMLITDGLAVFLGDRIAGRVQMKWVRWVAASTFFVFSFVAVLKAISLSSL